MNAKNIDVTSAYAKVTILSVTLRLILFNDHHFFRAIQCIKADA